MAKKKKRGRPPKNKTKRKRKNPKINPETGKCYKTPSPNDGRPRIEFDQFDFLELDKLCQIQCGLEEIADWFGVSADTIENRVKEKYGITFSEHFRKKSAQSRVTLRRMMWSKAINNNDTTMQIFLSKQKHLLNYTDRVQDDSYAKVLAACMDLEKEKANEAS